LYLKKSTTKRCSAVSYIPAVAVWWKLQPRLTIAYDMSMIK